MKVSEYDVVKLYTVCVRMRESGNLDEAEEQFLDSIVSSQDDGDLVDFEISEDSFGQWKDKFVLLIFELDELLIETSNDSNEVLRDKINILLNRFRQIFKIESE